MTATDSRGTQSPETAQTAFDRLAPGVRAQLWRMGWQELRQIQVDTIHEIMTGDRPILLSAATASGKTEAAFLPILSRIVDLEPGSVRALYVGPLRALINDQFQRLETMCEKLHIPVHRWHGDVDASRKRKLVNEPGGVLLLTPESLESLFINRSVHLKRLFSGLQFVVIDEIHVFAGTERGRQLRSLLHRLDKISNAPARRIGLSATIDSVEDSANAPAAARRLLCAESPERVVWISDPARKPLGYRIHTYLNPVQDHPGKPVEDEAEAEPEPAAGLIVERKIATDIARDFTGKTSLIFANRRGDVEVFANLTRDLTRNEVAVHHGSLSREIREDTEELLKASANSKPVTAFCSSTLELGIDLGEVAAVGQIGELSSAASLTQRAGRSGRGEGQKRVMRVYLDLDQPAAGDGIFDRLQLRLIQTLAVTELMLEGYVEPAAESACDLSTLTQQIISVIAQRGGVTAPSLYDLLCKEGPFAAVERALFVQLLRCLGEKGRDVIEQTPEGELILGLAGERIRASRNFYAVFPTPEEYALHHEARILGHMPMVSAPPPEEYILFAGRRWQVATVDEDRRQINVKPAKGWKRPLFSGDQAEVHPKVREKMREILAGTQTFAYLDALGTEELERARQGARLSRITDRGQVSLSERTTALLLWTGSKLDLSVRLLLMAAGAILDPDRASHGVAVVCRNDEAETWELLDRAAELRTPAAKLARLLPPKEKRRRKYDYLLTDELIDESFARDFLDVEGAKGLLRNLR